MTWKAGTMFGYVFNDNRCVFPAFHVNFQAPNIFSHDRFDTSSKVHIIFLVGDWVSGFVPRSSPLQGRIPIRLLFLSTSGREKFNQEIDIYRYPANTMGKEYGTCLKSKSGSSFVVKTYAAYGFEFFVFFFLNSAFRIRLFWTAVKTFRDQFIKEGCLSHEIIIYFVL